MNDSTATAGNAPASAVPLSITVDTLPRGESLRVYGIPVTAEYTHHLVMVDEAATIDLVVHSSRALPAPVRALLLVALNVPDPDTDAAGYRAARWWVPSQTFTLDLIRGMERDGKIKAWPGNSSDNADHRRGTDSVPPSDGALFDAADLTGQDTIDNAIATVEAEQAADIERAVDLVNFIEAETAEGIRAALTADIPDGADSRLASAFSTGDERGTRSVRTPDTVPFAQVRALLDTIEAVLDLPKVGAPDWLIYRHSFMSGVLSTVEDGRGANHAAVLLRKLANAAQGTEEVNR